LEKLKTEVLEWLKPLAEHRSDLVEKAKEYVRNNVDKADYTSGYSLLCRRFIGLFIRIIQEARWSKFY